MMVNFAVAASQNGAHLSVYQLTDVFDNDLGSLFLHIETFLFASLKLLANSEKAYLTPAPAAEFPSL